MGELRTWAIEVSLLRQLVPAEPSLAPRLRAIASERFRVPAAERRSPGLLGKLGPLLLRAPDAPVLPPGTPTHNQVEALIAGRFVAPEDLQTAWTTISCWLDELSWGQFRLPLGPGEFEHLDYDLGLAGLPSDHGPRRLMSRDTQLLVRPPRGASIGYSRHAFVLECAEQLAGVVGDVPTRSQSAARRLAEHLASYRSWAHEAEQAGRAAPDLFAILVD